MAPIRRRHYKVSDDQTRPKKKNFNRDKSQIKKALPDNESAPEEVAQNERLDYSST